MECPNCGYEHGWSGKVNDKIIGEEGVFFEMSNQVQMEREHEYRAGMEKRNVYGCPKCSILFMSKW